MNKQISLEMFKSEVFDCLEEIFVRHHGSFLDKGTSFFETLDTISAAEASRSATENGATIAAHVEHVGFFSKFCVRFGKRKPSIKLIGARFGKPSMLSRMRNGKSRKNDFG